jgi:predicted Holliday junction resolvase-like endonuclease
MIEYLIIIILIFLVAYFYLQKKRMEKKIKLSARIISGKTIEKLIPFFKNFKYDLHDMRFLGEPIDYIIFDGYSKKNLKQIIFLEVKSGKSKLTKEQNEVKKIIKKKKVKWEEVKI